MDFWGSLTARMPRDLNYETLCEQFSWNLPAHYNMGVDVCDRHARDKGKLALIFDRGTARRRSGLSGSSSALRTASRTPCEV